MPWLKSNWRWLALNLLAGSVLLIVLSRGSGDLTEVRDFDPGLESGKWAIRFLLICLAMSPLKTYFGWSGAIKLRKPAGLWSFGFAVVHLLFFTREARLDWLAWPMPAFLALGLSGLLILAALAATSNRWAMRRLRKNWKRLHRLVYPAGLTMCFHAILATAASKKVALYDPQAVTELNVYLAVLVAVLVVRTPAARRLLKRLSLPLPQRGRVETPVTPIVIPDQRPGFWPKVNGREAAVSLDDLLAEIDPEAEAERRRLAPTGDGRVQGVAVPAPRQVADLAPQQVQGDLFHKPAGAGGGSLAASPPPTGPPGDRGVRPAPRARGRRR